MVRPFEQEPVVALEFTVVGSEYHISLGRPALVSEGVQHPAQGLVDQLVLDMGHGVDLAYLVGGETGWGPVGWSLVVGDQGPVIPTPPVRGFGVECSLSFHSVLRITGWEIQVAPRDSVEFGRRRVPRVVGVWEAQPTEPVVVGFKTVEPLNSPIGNPVRVVGVSWYLVVTNLRGSAVPASFGVYVETEVEDGEEATDVLRVVLSHPPSVVH